MHLSKKNLSAIINANVDIPSINIFDLPEKVIQFGTGVLLRALPDYFIDKANKKRIFNGRVVIVKSTDSGSTDSFEQQDGLYTVCVRGIQDGKNIEENIINASVSRVISAKKNWNDVLQCAANPEMQIVISNTTEVGLVLANDKTTDKPPSSFPGKLLAFLYQRYKIFNGDESKGMVIIPTELIPQNADKLFSILETLAKNNELGNDFLYWLKNANHFCNSLVDRIVPGKLNNVLQKENEAKFGYEDELMIMSEAYKLWAIESADEKAKEILSFARADSDVVITPDIELFRELKLRLLNGAHTFCCGLAYLAGFSTVKEAMSDQDFSFFIKKLMLTEIAPAIVSDNLSIDQANDFAEKVLDRFRNSYIDHLWLNITLQYSSKMQMRNVPTIIKYAKKFSRAPNLMALGFAAYLFFTKPAEIKDNRYYGRTNGNVYLINDDKALYFYEAWKEKDFAKMVEGILSNENLWSVNLNEIVNFADAVKSNLKLLMNLGTKNALKQIKESF